MKTIDILILLICILTIGCSNHSSENKLQNQDTTGDQSIEQRVKALDDYVKRGIDSRPPDEVREILTNRAKEIFKERLPEAYLISVNIKSTTQGMANITVIYSVRAMGVHLEQKIDCFFEDGIWHMFWLDKDGPIQVN